MRQGLEVGGERGPEAVDVAAVAAERRARSPPSRRRRRPRGGRRRGGGPAGGRGRRHAGRRTGSQPPYRHVGRRSIARTARDPIGDGARLRSWTCARGSPASTPPCWPASSSRSSAGVPLERWTDPAGAGGSSIAWLAFHTAYHEDLAVNAVLRAATARAARAARRARPRRPSRRPSGSARPSSPSSPRRSTSTPSSPTCATSTTPRPCWLATLDPRRARRRRRRRRPRARAAGVDEADVPWLLPDVGRQAGGVVRAVGGDRPSRQPPRRDGVGPQPPRPEPVLTPALDEPDSPVSPRARSR